jgi:hypothetical protein
MSGAVRWFFRQLATSLGSGPARASVAYRGYSGAGITAVDLVLVIVTGHGSGAAATVLIREATPGTPSSANPGGDPRNPRNVRPPGYPRGATRLFVPDSCKREAQWLTGLSFAAPASTI